ncbi:MAG: hypothetical protein OEL76_09800 [Siculibacillus sp.]|nr:hypothetical protein [Siculibacillus sp.]
MGGEAAEADAASAALALLEGARAARSDPETSETAVLAALALAPDDLDVRIGAYKFYFYNSRLREALPHAAWTIAHAARALGLPEDWRKVEPGAAAFDTLDEGPRLFLQSLLAWGWCKARLGDLAEGIEAMTRVARLDPHDRFGAARLAEVVRREGRDDADD